MCVRLRGPTVHHQLRLLLLLVGDSLDHSRLGVSSLTDNADLLLSWLAAVLLLRLAGGRLLLDLWLGDLNILSLVKLLLGCLLSQEVLLSYLTDVWW